MPIARGPIFCRSVVRMRHVIFGMFSLISQIFEEGLMLIFVLLYESERWWE